MNSGGDGGCAALRRVASSGVGVHLTRVAPVISHTARGKYNAAAIARLGNGATYLILRLRA